MQQAFLRITQGVALLVCIAISQFLLLQLSPGDPMNRYFGPATSRRSLDKMHEKLDRDAPWVEQFGKWSMALLQGNAGYSWSRQRPVADVIAQTLPATLQLAGLALLLSLVVGSIWGFLTGLFAEHLWAKALDVLLLFLYSLPTFWVALILIRIFSLQLGWLPAGQINSVWTTGMHWSVRWWDNLRHLILPVTALSLSGAAVTARFVRAEMLDILRKDYILLSFAHGLPRSYIYFYRAFRNALTPVVTLFGIYLPMLFSGTLVVEVLFAWPGMGRVMYEAVFARDYPLIMAINLMAGILVILGNAAADMVYPLLDPRKERYGQVV